MGIRYWTNSNYRLCLLNGIVGFKKIRGLDSEEIFETKVTDGTGKLLSKWKCLKEDFPEVVRILNKKFCFNLKIKKKPDRDLDWLK